MINVNALALQPLEDGTDRAVDLESGDIYVWDPNVGSSGMYVLEPKEVVTEYVTLPTDQNDIELLTLQNNVSELEETVAELTEENENLTNTISDLEDEVSLLEDQISVMAAYDAADENLGTTNVALFEGIIEKIPYGQHYVYWRDSQYSYRLAYGNITFDGSSFTGEGDVIVCTYESTGTNYNSNYNYYVSIDRNFTLDPGQELVYSDLGSYPALGQRSELIYEALCAYTLVVFGLFFVFDRLRTSCFRS